MPNSPEHRSFKCLLPPALILDPARWSMRSGWDQETTAAPHFEVGFIQRGATWWHSDQRVMRVSAGSAYLICPGGYSRSRVPSEQRGDVVGWKITFEWTGFEHRRSSDDADVVIDEVTYIPPQSRRQLNAAFDGIHRLFLDATPGWELAASGYLLVILAQLARCSSTGMEAAARQLDRRLAPSLEFMQKNINRPFKIAAVAAASGLTEDYFRRRFHEVFGATPQEYVQRLRLGRARRILAEEPQNNIAEVCRAAGFGDAKHFSRLFRQRFGVGPRDFRQRLLALRPRS